MAGGEDCGHKLRTLSAILKECGPRVIACSGGLDSMLLAYLAQRDSAAKTLVAHGGSAAVPSDASFRLKSFAAQEGWNLVYVQTGEFNDESYLSNPQNRCYFCKKHLYAALSAFHYSPSRSVFQEMRSGSEERDLISCEIMSGTNLDDLGEYRPGLDAAKERGVRHPYVEAGLTKNDLRSICRDLALPFSDLAASPCLASRLYTGTRVTGRRLELVDKLEISIREKTSIAVVRGRLKDRTALIEVGAADRPKITEELLRDLRSEFLQKYSDLIESIALDAQPYRPGRSFVVMQ